MRVLFCLGLLLAICPRLFAGDVLTARFTDDLSEVGVELCFDGPAPKRLSRNNQTGRWAGNILHNDQPIRIRKYDDTVRLPDLPDNSCLNWLVNLDGALAALNSRSILKVGDDLIMSADIWFWQGPPNRNLGVRIQLPEGMSFSTPWQPAGREGGFDIYRPDNTPSSWEAKVALGKLNIQLLDIPGAQLRLAMPGDLSDAQRNTLVAWIQESAASISLVSGSFPQPNPQVLIVPTGNRGRADMFGQVLRGGGVAALFYVNQDRPLQEFRDGWTATHEFSHMLLPYISSRDRWLSEGLASYYQNVLRARDGRITPTVAWQGLYDGFERGIKATNDDTLAEATRAGRESTMRVYWSGAALMLMADVQLRQASKGQQSLDSALTLLAACCLQNGKTWRARDMFKKLDELTDSQIFSDLYQKYVNSDDFPNLQDSWDTLGIEIENHRVNLKKQAPLIAVRTAIMKG